MISIEVLQGRSALDTIAADWENLVGDTFATAFSQPAWYSAWLDAFNTSNVAFVTAREGNRMIGVLPLARVRTDARGLYFAEVGPLARGDYMPPVVAPEYAAAALPAMLDAALTHFGRRGVFWWPNIPEADPSVELLRSYFTAAQMPFIETREPAPRVRLDGRDFATLEKSWTSKHRVDVRRRRNRLAEQGPVTLWQPTSVSEAEPVLEEFFRVHDAKWLGEGFPGMFQQPENRRHFHAILRRLWNRGVHFSTVRCGDTHISYHFGFFSGGWVQWYRPSYRPEFHNYSPSKIHVAMVLEEACRQNWNGLDFLLGGEPWKDPWKNETREVVTFHAGFHQWAPSYFWFSRGKPYVKERLALSYVRSKSWLQKRRQRS